MPLLLILILCFVHITSYWITIRSRAIAGALNSLLSGASVTYLFVIALPEVFANTAKEVLYINLVALALGFVLLHVLQSSLKESKLQNYSLLQARLHEVIFFVYSLASGFLLSTIAVSNIPYAIIILIALALHSILSELVIKKIEGRAHLEERTVHILISVAPLLGYFLSIVASSYFAIIQLFISLAVGIAFYVAIREEIPESKDERRPLIFLIGSLVIVVLTAIV